MEANEVALALALEWVPVDECLAAMTVSGAFSRAVRKRLQQYGDDNPLRLTPTSDLDALWRCGSRCDSMTVMRAWWTRVKLPTKPYSFWKFVRTHLKALFRGCSASADGSGTLPRGSLGDLSTGTQRPRATAGGECDCTVERTACQLLCIVTATVASWGWCAPARGEPSEADRLVCPAAERKRIDRLERRKYRTRRELFNLGVICLRAQHLPEFLLMHKLFVERYGERVWHDEDFDGESMPHLDLFVNFIRHPECDRLVEAGALPWSPEYIGVGINPLPGALSVIGADGAADIDRITETSMQAMTTYVLLRCWAGRHDWSKRISPHIDVDLFVGAMCADWPLVGAELLRGDGVEEHLTAYLDTDPTLRILRVEGNAEYIVRRDRLLESLLGTGAVSYRCGPVRAVARLLGRIPIVPLSRAEHTGQMRYLAAAVEELHILPSLLLVGRLIMKGYHDCLLHADPTSIPGAAGVPRGERDNELLTAMVGRVAGQADVVEETLLRLIDHFGIVDAIGQLAVIEEVDGVSAGELRYALIRRAMPLEVARGGIGLRHVAPADE